MNHSDAPTESIPLLYTDFAEWWPLLSAPEDYEEEAQFFYSTFLELCKKPPKIVLELGSGGGNNASYLKKHFQMTLVDRSPGMLAVSQALNPECEHIQADMRSLALNRRFDGVFIHDAIVYCTNLRDLHRVLRVAYDHVVEEGVVLVTPDFTRETFRPSTQHGGHDAPDGRGVRYLSWTYDPDPEDTTYVSDYVYLLRDAAGHVRSIYDRHIEGLFSQREWLNALSDAGCDPQAIRDPFERVIFAGIKCKD
jgi:SAM-dependent methyltransferase